MGQCTVERLRFRRSGLKEPFTSAVALLGLIFVGSDSRGSADIIKVLLRADKLMHFRNQFFKSSYSLENR